MTGQRRNATTLLLVLTSFFAFPCTAKTRDCFSPIRHALVVGGYGNGLDCRKLNVKLRRIGRISKYRRPYTVYDTFYTFAVFSGGIRHGDERILFINSKNVDEAQYYVGGPLQNLRATKSGLKIDAPAKYGTTISLTRNGLTKNVQFNAEILKLDR
jgi:hypothetical protein